jgi:hypothetical protein
MTVREKWKSKIAGPWPLFGLADEKWASHVAGPDRDWTWTARGGVPISLPSVCPHRGMPLAHCRVEAGQAVCPYHGLRLAPLQDDPMFRFMAFDWAGEQNSAVRYLAAQAQDQPWMKEVFRLEGASSAPLILCLENFLDATHTAHIHPKMVRQAGSEKWIKARGVARDWGFEIEYEENGVQSGWLGRMGEPPRSTSFGRYLHPCAAQVDYLGLDGKSYFRATAFMRPKDEGTQILVVVESSLWRMGLGPLQPFALVTKALFAKVLHQDIEALDRAWRGIAAKGWGPDDLLVRSEDLAWPWMCRWMNQNPPKPGEIFAGQVLA